MEVTQIRKKLKPREKRFCSAYLCTCDAAQAARRAGFRHDFAQKGEALLCDERILGEIERLSARRIKTLSSLAAAGYSRLAFGDISDALTLLYNKNPTPEQLGLMDLMMISEIKSKDGNLEIKFFDRLKALDRLENAAPRDTGVSGLFDAIGKDAYLEGGDDVD